MCFQLTASRVKHVCLQGCGKINKSTAQHSENSNLGTERQKESHVSYKRLAHKDLVIKLEL
jgi:hypothetical protein